MTKQLEVGRSKFELTNNGRFVRVWFDGKRQQTMLLDALLNMMDHRLEIRQWAEETAPRKSASS
jgi:hypothetical protein